MQLTITMMMEHLCHNLSLISKSRIFNNFSIKMQVYIQLSLVVVSDNKVLDENGLEELFTNAMKLSMTNPVIGHIMVNCMEMK